MGRIIKHTFFRNMHPVQSKSFSHPVHNVFYLCVCMCLHVQQPHSEKMWFSYMVTTSYYHGNRYINIIMETGSMMQLMDVGGQGDGDSLASDMDIGPPTGNYYQTMEKHAQVIGEAEKTFLKLVAEEDVQAITKHLEVSVTLALCHMSCRASSVMWCHTQYVSTGMWLMCCAC